MLDQLRRTLGEYNFAASTSRRRRRRAAGETLEQIAGHAPTTPEAEKTPSLLDIYLAERKKHDGV